MGSLPLAGGGTLDGTILNESGFDAQLRTAGGHIVLLRREGDGFREAALEPSADWPSYHGSYTGNRHSPLDQIGRGNIDGLAMQWFYPIPDMPMIEGTPVVIAGVMYVTAVNQVYALDAATGREIWSRSSHEGAMKGTDRPHDAAFEVLPVFGAFSTPGTQAAAKGLGSTLPRRRSRRQTPVRRADEQRRAAVREAGVRIQVECQIPVDSSVTLRQIRRSLGGRQHRLVSDRSLALQRCAALSEPDALEVGHISWQARHGVDLLDPCDRGKR